MFQAISLELNKNSYFGHRLKERIKRQYNAKIISREI
jgi:hypothetical protein